MNLGTREINGVETEVHADKSGRFYIQINGKSVGSGTTLDAAVAEARNTINKDKTVVNVEFVTKDGGERGVATGFHSRNRTTMAKVAGGRGQQLDYNYRAFRADIPKAKLDRYFEIQEQIRTLQAEKNGLDKEYEIMLREHVQQAITNAQSKTLGGVTARAAARRTGTKRRL